MRRKRVPAYAFAAALHAAPGCEGTRAPTVDDGGPELDAFVDGADDLPRIQPASAPVAPSLPILAPCPVGWREDGTRDTTVCEPWPPGGRSDCPLGEEHFPGEQGCMTVGAPCPAGAFPDGLPADRPILYVLAGAGESPDGTQLAPYATIGDALALASGGDVIAIGRGEYAEAISPGSVTLWGACAAETILRAAPNPARAVLDSTAEDLVVRNLTLASSDRVGIHVSGRGTHVELDGVVITEVGRGIAGILVEDGAEAVVHDTTFRDVDGTGAGVKDASLELRRVRLDASRWAGVIAQDGASLLLEDVAIVGTRPAGALGFGLYASSNATSVTGARIVIEDNMTAGILLIEDHGEPHASLEHVVVRDTFSDPVNLTSGMGLQAENAVVSVRWGLFERNRDLNVLARGLDASITLTDVVVRDTERRELDLEQGVGVAAAEGATLTFARGLLARNHNVGIEGRDAVLHLADVTIHDTVHSSGIPWGGGVVLDGSIADLARVEVTNSDGGGVYVTKGGVLEAQDLTVRRTYPFPLLLPDGSGAGPGLSVNDGSTAHVERAHIRESTGVGVTVFEREPGPSSDLEIEDTLIVETRASVSGMNTGLGAAGAVDLLARRCVLERNGHSGLFAGLGARVEVEDLIVRDTGSTEGPTVVDDRVGLFGYGLLVSESTLQGLRILLEHNRDVSAFVEGEFAVMHLDGVAILDTQPRECALDSCPAEPAGTGAGAYAGGSLELSRFTIGESALCGAQVATGGSLQLQGGIIRSNAVGVCVQVDGYDIASHSQDVVFEDNGVNVDSSDMPIPDVAIPQL